jgi:hypothetical protein
MNRVNWDGMPLETPCQILPANLRETIFDYLPPPVAMTTVIEELAEKYLNGQIIWREYAAMQAAAFIRPKSQDQHQKRRHALRREDTRCQEPFWPSHPAFLMPSWFQVKKMSGNGS